LPLAASAAGIRVEKLNFPGLIPFPSRIRLFFWSS